MDIEPAANWTVSPFVTPEILLVVAPCAWRSGEPLVFQISRPTTVDHDPVADQDTELLLVIAAGDVDVNVENAVAPIVAPPAVYPEALSSVPLLLCTLPLPEPSAVISLACSGVVIAVMVFVAPEYM